MGEPGDFPITNRNRDFVDSKYLQVCDIPKVEPIKPFVLVIFGGAGDLSRKKLLPTLCHLCGEGEITFNYSIIGVGKSRLFNTATDINEEYRKITKDSVGSSFNENERKFDEHDIAKFLCNISFIYGAYDDDNVYQELQNVLTRLQKETHHLNIIYYMAVPPVFFSPIIEKMDQYGLNFDRDTTRIIIEKPFGTDLTTAVTLNEILSKVFNENQIYRIDHYLGKETVQNIIFFRFSNSIFEPLWNRRYIDNVQITVAEDIGIESRGKFYEQSGVIRDIIQNHMMQLIGLVAMEPPVGFEANLIRNEKVKVLQSMRIVKGNEIDNYMVGGQYGAGIIKGKHAVAYRDEHDVSKTSHVPTFFAGKFFIDSWRWANVPFYVRAGKRLRKRVTEICIQFKQPPLRLFGRNCDPLQPGYLMLRIQPKEQIILRFGVKYPNIQNKISPVSMKFDYQEYFNEKNYPAYSRLLLDCLRGDLTLFVRQDGVETMWGIVDPIIEYWENNPPKDFPNYRSGSWGPAASDELLKKDNHHWLSNYEV